ncbi:alpha/beta fold hydrolase [Alkalihalobacillus sp. 1P02AB]|uniref:alpha/beta fold hydrolase n=1 Tax=Alkalihalobacillus sp. 1P02AB TaxID=3132260 RepID=UPI0039A4DD9C
MHEVDRFLQVLYQKESRTVVGKKERKAYLQKTIGTFEPPKEADAKLLWKQVTNRYVEMAYVLPTTNGLQLSFRLLEPKQKKDDSPVIIALHGHGKGAEEALDPNSIHNGFAETLVDQGATVLLPELIGFGRRKQESEEGENSCYTLASHLLLYGKTLAGLRVFECKRLLDWYEKKYHVSQFGCFGFSGGGLIALLLSCLDERVRATVLSGYGSLLRDSILTRRHCLDNYIPNVLLIGETTDLIELVEPRPILIESGHEDLLFPTQSIQQLAKSQHHVTLDSFDGKHEVNGEKSIPWLLEQMKKEK